MSILSLANNVLERNTSAQHERNKPQKSAQQTGDKNRPFLRGCCAPSREKFFSENESDKLPFEGESRIREWLAHIDETDPDIIEETILRCRDNLEAREYFLMRSKEVPQPVRDANDDRRFCRE